MAKKGYTPEQIINKLREAEIRLQQGATIAMISNSSPVILFARRQGMAGMGIAG